MPDMNGLLDFVKTPAGQGLLAAAFGAAATAGRGGPVNTLGAAGLSGIAGYSAASGNALKQQKADMLQRQREAIPALYGKDATGNTTFDWQTAAALLPPDDVLKYAQLPNATKSKVARTIDVPGADGNKQTMQYDEYGQPVGQAINSYVAPQLVDTGGSKQFAVPTAGQSFAMSMSPGERAADARGWANVGAKQQQNSILQDANNINRMAQRTQIVAGADGNNYLVDKGTGEARPAVIQGGGGQVQSGPIAEATIKNQKNMGKLGELIQQARQSLPNATASGLGAKRDEVARFFGQTTSNAQAAAKLGTIGGNMMMMMPRMEGPQSDADRKNYETMAGKVGDPTIPAAERAAAMDAIEEIANRYSGQPPKAASQPAEPPKASILRTGKDASGRKVIQYTDGRIEYGN